jgi:predicted dehydrogenase
VTLRLAIAGCGVMGRRHVRGLGKLRQIGRFPFALVAACDPVPENAAALADLAERTLGRRPRVFATLDELLASESVDALDITVAPALHPSLAVEAFAAGLHVLVEKPIALTVRGGREMLAAANASRCVLAVAENYRRDPINRLAKALIDAGAIGRAYLAVQASSGSGERVIITPWRHRKTAGGIAIDMGVHYADILEYLLGEISQVMGMGSLVDDVRIDRDGGEHPADAEDLTVGVARFAGGALASWILDLAGRGEECFRREIYGTQGTLAIPQDRTGRPPRLTVSEAGGTREVVGDEQLDLVPEFALDATTAALFGGERVAAYELAWADVDANLLAIELADFARAITDGRQPEVTGEMGLRSLAVAYGFLESERTGRMLDVAHIVDGQSTPYQDEIDAAMAATA